MTIAPGCEMAVRTNNKMMGTLQRRGKAEPMPSLWSGAWRPAPMIVTDVRLCGTEVMKPDLGSEIYFEQSVLLCDAPQPHLRDTLCLIHDTGSRKRLHPAHHQGTPEWLPAFSQRGLVHPHSATPGISVACQCQPAALSARWAGNAGPPRSSSTQDKIKESYVSPRSSGDTPDKSCAHTQWSLGW